MKYILYRDVKTINGNTYRHYLKTLSSEEKPYVIMATMQREEAKVYSSRGSVFADLRKLGSKWNFQKL